MVETTVVGGRFSVGRGRTEDQKDEGDTNVNFGKSVSSISLEFLSLV